MFLFVSGDYYKCRAPSSGGPAEHDIVSGCEAAADLTLLSVIISIRPLCFAGPNKVS